MLAQTQYIRTARELRREGAEIVIAGEEEAALSMAGAVLRALGATEEQVSAERREARRLWR